jgi:hypothetical protein
LHRLLDMTRIFTLFAVVAPGIGSARNSHERLSARSHLALSFLLAG